MSEKQNVSNETPTEKTNHVCETSSGAEDIG